MDYKIHTHATYATCEVEDSFLVAPAYDDGLGANKDKQFFSVNSFFLKHNVTTDPRWSDCGQQPMQARPHTPIPCTHRVPPAPSPPRTARCPELQDGFDRRLRCIVQMNPLMLPCAADANLHGPLSPPPYDEATLVAAEPAPSAQLPSVSSCCERLKRWSEASTPLSTTT